MTTQHTPGPWTMNTFSGPNLTCCGAGIAEVYADNGGKATSVARVAYPDTHGDFGARVEQCANARLIALAPEMVTEIEYLCDILSNVENQHAPAPSSPGWRGEP